MERKKLWRGLTRGLSQVTLEPLVFLHGLADFVGRFADDQMILYKICREEKFNLTVDFCNHIESHTNSTAYSDVEKEVVNFNNIIAITNNVIPILLSFYLGSWSDQFGRLPFLALYMLGRTLAGLANFLNAVYLEEWGRWVWLATVMPPLNLSGGIVSYIVMVYSFISDNTTVRDRTFRMALTSFLWRVSSLIGLPLSALIYNKSGYTGVMATGLGLYILASIYGLIRLWGFQENIQKTKLDLAQLFSPKHVIDIFKASFRSRPGRKQVYILMMMLVMMAFMMPEDAESMVQFMYTKRMFQWEYDTFSYYNTIQNIMSMVGVVLIMPLFHYFNGNDNIIIISSGISKILSQLVRAFALSEKVFFFSTVVGTLRIIYNAPVRAQISRCVEPRQLGKVFAMLGVFEAFVPIIASSVFTKLYNVTSDLEYPWYASYYFGTIGVVIIGILLTIIVYLGNGRKQIIAEKDEDDQLENGIEMSSKSDKSEKSKL